MTETAEKTDTTFLQQCRAYISLRNELMGRGAELAKAMQAREGTATTIVKCGGEYWELVRLYSVGAREIPVSVSKAEVIGD